jgi:hypothetical protein
VKIIFYSDLFRNYITKISETTEDYRTFQYTGKIEIDFPILPEEGRHYPLRHFRELTFTRLNLIIAPNAINKIFKYSWV